MLPFTTPDKRKRRRALRTVISAGVDLLGVVAHLDRKLHVDRAQLEVTRDVPYLATDNLDHRLDVYRPKGVQGPLPALIYIHGGGFQLGSKETHGAIAVRFAARGMVVFNINYRLVPAVRYPAVAEDAAEALLWVQANAATYGADPERLILAGESAGGNLCAALAAAATIPSDEAWAAAVYASKPKIKALLPACGMHNMRDSGRCRASRKFPSWICERVEMVAQAYQPDPQGPLLLDSPSLWIAAHPQATPLPPTCIIVGDKDPVYDDSIELEAALKAHGGRVDLHVYSGEVHAFHALWWRDAAARAWQTQYDFLRSEGLIP